MDEKYFDSTRPTGPSTKERANFIQSLKVPEREEQYTLERIAGRMGRITEDSKHIDSAR